MINVNASSTPRSIPSPPVSPNARDTVPAADVLRQQSDVFETDGVCDLPEEEFEQTPAAAASAWRRTWDTITRAVAGTGLQFVQGARLLGNAVLSTAGALLAYLVAAFTGRANVARTSPASSDADLAAMAGFDGLPGAQRVSESADPASPTLADQDRRKVD